MKKPIESFSLLMGVLLLTSCLNSPTSSGTAVTAAPNKKIIILAVDGGGIKGIIPAVFLDSIEARTQKQSFQLFDLIGGTSTGGIIAVALTSMTNNPNRLPFNAQELVGIYGTQGSKLFVPQGCEVDFCATYYASNGNQGIEPYLQSILPTGLTLSAAKAYMNTLPGRRVQQMFTTSYVVNSTGGAIPNPARKKDYGPYLFNWYDAAAQPKDNYFAWEAARGTSAAPTYFPIAHVGGNVSPRSAAAEKWVVDGGMMSNDPSIWGISEAFRTGIATRLEDIIVISLGTGIYPGDAGVGINNNSGDLTPKDGNWSETPWVMEKMYDLEGAENSRGTVLNIVLDAVQLASDAQLKALRKSGLTYFRLEPVLTKTQSQMDNIQPGNISSLVQSAQNYVASGPGKSTLDSIIVALKTY